MTLANRINPAIVLHEKSMHFAYFLLKQFHFSLHFLFQKIADCLQRPLPHFPYAQETMHVLIIRIYRLHACRLQLICVRFPLVPQRVILAGDDHGRRKTGKIGPFVMGAGFAFSILRNEFIECQILQSWPEQN
jgi:hypothetical protein